MSFRALVLDNRDSFVFNLVDDLRSLGGECTVVRSSLSPEGFEGWMAEVAPDLVLLSPGPGEPSDHPALLPFLKARPELPVLGVCLGMQAMAAALGGRVSRAEEGPVHGKAGRVVHERDALFDGLPASFQAGRYHSLVVAEMPDELVPIAWTEERDVVLALRHRTLPWVGLQFHPESVLTPLGRRLIQNFIRSLS